jgi:hypothetical protein
MTGSTLRRRLLGTLALAAAGSTWPVYRWKTQRPDIQQWASPLGDHLKEARAGLHTRVSTLAELPRLAAAVATDAATVADLTQDELAFRPHPGETIAIGQINKRSGKPAAVLLLTPPNATLPSFEQRGTRFQILHRQFVVTEAVEIVPRERAEEVRGVLVVSAEIDVSAVSAAMAKEGVQAELLAGGNGLPLGADVRANEARRSLVTLTGVAGAPEESVSLAVYTPVPSAPVQIWVVTVALGVLGVALWVWRDKKTVGSGLLPVWSPQGPTPAGGTLPAPRRTFAASDTPSRRMVKPTPIALPGKPIGQVGRYELLKRVGMGGMAEVFLARVRGEAGFAKLVALKVLLPDYAAQPQLVDLFLDEARLAAQVYHPNIVQTVDLGRAEDNYFIAMEYIDGADLLRLIGLSQSKKQLVPIDIALTILRSMCAGLQAAHDATHPDGQPLGLVHRDVKSANVFVSINGVVKVGDFGIAKAHHAGWVRRTEDGMVKGTPGYMAPEQRLGHTIDARADLYGVGAVGYELLTCQPINLDFMLLASKGREGWPHLAPLSSFRSDIPKELESILLRCLSFDREERFESCATLEMALEAVALAHPPVATEKAISYWIEALLAHDTARVSLER